MLHPHNAWGGNESYGQMVRRIQRVRAKPGQVLPALLLALHSNLACSPHHSGTEWEYSIIFWPHKSYVSLKSKMWTWSNTGRWAGKWDSEFGFAEDVKSLDIQSFWGVGSKKVYMCCFFLRETLITSNSVVRKAGDWQYSLMLFKIRCFPLTVAWFFFYRNALTRYCSNFPNRSDSPSLLQRL